VLGLGVCTVFRRMLDGVTKNSVTTFRLTASGSMEPNPTTFTSRSSAFVSAAGGLGGAVLLVTRDESGVASFVQLTTGSAAAAARAADHLAVAVAANAQPVESGPDLSAARVVASLQVAAGSATGRDTLNGVDLTEAARTLARSLGVGQWVAVSLRGPTRQETRRHRRWLEDRMGTKNPTHHSLASDAVVVSVRVGADDAHSAANLVQLVRSTMPGFDQDAVSRVQSRWRLPLVWAAGGVAASAAAGVVPSLLGVDPLVAAGWPATGGLVGLAVGGVGALLAAGVLPSRAGRVRSRVERGTVPVPWRSPALWRKPKDTRDEDGSVTHREAGYPLHREVFKVGPQVVAGLVAPHAGALTGGSSTAARATPPALTGWIGPLIGTGADGQPVHLSARDMRFGVCAMGRAGSGKSQLVRSLFAWALLDRLRPAGRPGFPGRAHTLVAFESKGDGADSYEAWGRALGHPPVIVEVADPATPAIDLFDVPGTVTQKAEFVANAMKYTFGDEAIGNRAFPVILRVLPASICMTDELALRAGAPVGGSPFTYAHLLCGGAGGELAEALWGVVNEEATRLESAGVADPDLSEARDQLQPLFRDMTAAARRSLVESSENKFYQLRMAERFWDPARPKKGWASILADHDVVVVNTGTTRSGMLVEDQMNEQVSAMLMFGLRHAIQRVCRGWQEAGRGVTIYADELALLAPTSPDVLTWLRNQGRSFGAKAVFASQYPEQLDPQVRMAVKSFSTMLTFRQEGGAIADDAADDAGSDGSTWTRADVVGLELYHAILRTDVDEKRVSACTVAIDNFESDMAAFPDRQGYGRPAHTPVAGW